MNKIKKIKITKFRGMDSESISEDVNEFKKYNLFYGWNGTGKTTMSDLFSYLQCDKELEISDKNLKCKIIFNDNGLDKEEVINKNNLTEVRKSFSIKVFNSNYVYENIGQESSGMLKHIVYLGKEAKETAEEINKFEEEIKVIQSEVKKNKESYNILENDLSTWIKHEVQEYIQYNKAIGNHIDTNSYKSPNLIKDLKQTDLESYKLTSQNRNTYLETVKSSPKELINIFYDYKFNIDVIDNAKKLLEDTVEIKHSIDRLIGNKDLNSWVYSGYKDFMSNNKCPFCEQPLTENFLKSLQLHYNKDVDDYVNKINMCCSNIKLEITKLDNHFKSLPNSSKLYDEFSKDYAETYNNLGKQVLLAISESNRILDLLENKKCNVGKIVKCDVSNKTFEFSFESLNKILESHNDKTTKFGLKISLGQKCLQLDFKANILHIYKEKNEILEKQKTDLKYKEKLLEEKNTKLEGLKAKIRDYIKPCDEINDYLKEFWGYTSLKLMPNDFGYSICRDDDTDEKAKHLSDGEKMAIAFCYFIKSLEDSSFDLQNSIIVIDDPISSLDSNSLFTTFGFITRKLKESGQLFVLTHNFLFFKEIRTWMEFTKDDCYYYTKKEGGKLKITNLPNTLKKRNSDYIELAKNIYTWANSELDMDEQDKMLAGNVARRFLEGFVKFKNLKNDNFFTKYNSLGTTTSIDDVKKARIYRFVNMFSHDDDTFGLYQEYDPILLLAQTKDILKDILIFISELDEFHYNSLLAEIQRS